ncbi:glycosyltransferase family 4 protein [candidate division KSB1 bacterium]|nr:glycosyltransferase family 4 protein [candidate division KSB1 bacterium]
MTQSKQNLLNHYKIIYIHKSGNGWGGAQQNVFDLIQHFRSEFKSAVFVCNSGSLLDRIKLLGITTYQVPISSIAFFPITLLSLARILIREKPELIHSNHRWATLLVQLLRKILPVEYKIIHTARSVFNRRTRCRFLGDKIIANSKAVQKNLVEKFRVPLDEIAIIYDGVKLNLNSTGMLNGQNDAVFQLLDLTQKTIIGCLGSLVPAKGHHVLFQAIARLDDSIRKNILVLIIGDGPLRKKLETEVRNLNLTEAIKFLGFRKDAHRILSYCDFTVIPSIQEGLPNVLIESYLLGKPAIVSELDYVDEVVKPYDVGMTFPLKDIHQLAELIRRYIQKPKLAARHGKRGNKLFKKWFSLENNLANYRQAYWDVMQHSIENHIET